MGPTVGSDRRAGLARVLVLALAVLAFVGVSTSGTRGEPPPRPRSAEEKRFDTRSFLNGLRKRGLVDLLDVYMREHPPRDAEARLLLERDLKRARYADPGLDAARRYAALHEANLILARLISMNPNDRRRFAWRMELARSLVYEEGERYFTAILYRSGSSDDHAQLLELTERALRNLETLRSQIDSEFVRLDALPLSEFDKLDRTGYVEELEDLQPKADYLWLWTLYYNALARDPADPLRTQRLKTLLTAIKNQSYLLETPQEESSIQAQALLLAALANRLAGHHTRAEDLFRRSAKVVRGLADEQQKRGLWWVVFLGGLESVRNLADSGRFEDALFNLDQLRLKVAGTDQDGFQSQLVIALAERSIHQHQATKASTNGRRAQAGSDRTQGAAALTALLHKYPSDRGEVYAALYHLLGPDADADHLDPLEQAALIAGLLGDAETFQARARGTDDLVQRHVIEGRATERLLRAIRLGDRFARGLSQQDPQVAAEMTYNVAVAAYRLGQTGKAADRFLRVARDAPAFSDAPKACLLAVQLASDIYQNADPKDADAARNLYKDALATLIQQYGHLPEAKYWRFFYGQVLEASGKFAAAADQFLLVDSTHANALEASFYRAHCLASAVEAQAHRPGVSQADVRRRCDEVFDLLRGFRQRVAGVISAESDPKRRRILEDLAARAALLPAELDLLPQIDKPSKALEALTDFEQNHPAVDRLTGRILRVRILANIELQRIDQAQRLVPEYIEADPQGAGATLQRLYDRLLERTSLIDPPPSSTREKRRAETMAFLAERIAAWGKDQPSLSKTDRTLLRLQHAEAMIRSGNLTQARGIFEACGGAEPVAEGGDSPVQARARLGLAEVLYRQGTYTEALSVFNELYNALEPGQPARWHALLRDLQCRDHLGHDPGGIIRAIENNRAQDPNLGGPPYAPALEKLLETTRHRIGGP